MILLSAALGLLLSAGAQALNLEVVDDLGNPVSGCRWLVEEDTTHWTEPGVPVNNSIGLSIHNSYAPVVRKGITAPTTNQEAIDIPADKRYFVSVLPTGGDYAMGGAPVAPNQSWVRVTVHKMPVPTAQISIYVFVDQNPINNVFDEHEIGLGGASIVISDYMGPLMADVFGNPLGTIYQTDAMGETIYDANGDPTVEMMGTGSIKTLTQEDFDAGRNPYNLKVGEALVKNIAPGKYGIVINPPATDDLGNKLEWSQTSTIEGTPTVDAWVKHNEPKLFVEGFGTGFNHAFFGFVKVSPLAPSPYKGESFEKLPWHTTPPAGTGRITGTLRYNHFAKPPNNQGWHVGMPVPNGWIGLNDALAKPGIQPAGLYAAPCDPATGYFIIDNVPPGTYTLVTWDTPLDSLFGTHTVVVPPGPGGRGQAVDLGNVLELRWFGTLEGKVFYDTDQDGFPDPGERGISSQAVNLRFRNGVIYQAAATNMTGEYSFAQVFPFFKWLVPEVDFLRYKPTGITAAVDEGGPVPPDNGWITPSRGKLNPQPQAGINPHTGNNLSRTEAGPVLTQAMHLFLNQSNIIDWGKVAYAPGENGGISGIVFYDSTRAEDDVRYCVGDAWQPGIPRVQMNLYADADRNGVIDDLNGDSTTTLADVDNYPLTWATNGIRGPEDVDRNGNSTWDPGDALNMTYSDSWDDNKPTGCIQDVPVIHGQPIQAGADAYGTWNQIRPGVFDGGYIFTGIFTGGMGNQPPGAAEVPIPPGTYIVEACPPPGYEIVKEEDKNVDFGEIHNPGKFLLPPTLVGDLHPVPAELTLFPGVPCKNAGQLRPLADRKQVYVTGGKNTAADFFFFTEVPKAARAVGFANNDLGAEFNQASVNFGEKLAPAWIPVAFRDWTGREITRVYTDEFGCYNAMLPSTFSANVPSPTGFSPHMITLVLNDPLMADGRPDPNYDPAYSVTPWTFHYMPGDTTYLDTPLVPVMAFTTAETRMDTMPPPSTPAIREVNGPEPGGGPVLFTTSSGNNITISSLGITQVPNPLYKPGTVGQPIYITRDYGFGNVQGQVTLNGVPIPIVSWSDAQIVATVPAATATGRLMVQRGDSALWTEIGVTLHVVPSSTPLIRVPAGQPTIQAAIDAASPGTLILVAPGTYNENVVMNKPVRLQGYGAGSTTIYGNPTPLERLDAWHARTDALGAREYVKFLLKDPFSENEAPCVIVIGELTYPNGNLQNQIPGFTTINPGFPFDRPGETMIDGFRLSGSKAGGAVFAVCGAKHLVVSNNEMVNNQGGYAGGMAVSTQDSGFDAQNYNVKCLYNKIHKNGGIQGGGGVSMNEYANDYLVEGNLVIGNFSRFNGAGINHRGLSPGNNIIRRNKVLFNEDHFNALLNKAGEGGGIYVGGDIAGGTGAGNVIIDGNWIQGNYTGSGHGGGICAFAINGDDVRQSPDNDADWYRLMICNNVIVNNIAALSGGGIWLSDVSRVSIVHNTIACNDAASNGQFAFAAGQANSTPQPAGVVSTPHSASLRALFGQTLDEAYCQPVLRNNIIWQNRSWYFDRSLNNGLGALAPNPRGQYWDLAVEGSTQSSHPHLPATNCILTSVKDPNTGYNYAASNRTGNPAFVGSYFNTLEAATVIDEMGNNVNVRFTPLTAAGSNYHIQSNSSAIGRADNTYQSYAYMRYDFDNEARPAGTPDAGADEMSGPANTAPTARADSYTMQQGTTLSLPVPGVLANDIDPQNQPLTASIVTSPAGGGTFNFNNNGSFTYTPPISLTGTVTFTYRATDGQLNSTNATVTVTILAAPSAPTPAVVYSFPLDTNPAGWTVQGQWAFGQPTGRGGNVGGFSGGNPDPAAGATGINVFGVNLNGNYSTAVGGPYYLTTPALNFSGRTGVQLTFRRWLNTDYQPFATATVQVSSNGTNWTTIYSNSNATPVTDNGWQTLTYNISAVADNQATVYIRWAYQVRAQAFAYSGWNIDDIELRAIQAPPLQTVYSFPMNTNPGWTVQGQWAFGAPTGGGGTTGPNTGGNPDPAAGATGASVYGVNLNGNYSTAAGGPYYLTSPAMNFSGRTGVQLRFRRWLNTDLQPFASATIQVSNNGVNWTTIYNNGTQAVTDSAWQTVTYNISAQADNQPTVYVRWGHQKGTNVRAYSGWNIDDVEFLANPASLIATIYNFPMDTIPGWTVQGQWAFGRPLGLGGSTGSGAVGNPDPTAGATGNNVYGVNLNGNYSTAVGGPYYLTTPALNFLGYTGIKLQFQRWLNTDFQPYVNAAIEVSNNGVNWTTVYANSNQVPTTDNAWQNLVYDISAVANNRPAVYVRWGYRIGSQAYAYSGWNIDDVRFLGTVTAAPPLAQNDAYGVTARTTLTVAAPGVLANDSDLNGNTFFAVLAQTTPNGTLALKPDGSFTYTPRANFTGVDTFTYRATDGVPSNLAMVTITVTAPAPAIAANAPPTPQAADIVTNKDLTGVTRIFPNDPNANDTITYTVTQPPTSGQVTVSAAGIVTYQPQANFVGQDQLKVKVADAAGASSIITIAIRVGNITTQSGAVVLQFPPDTDGVDTDGDGIVDNDHVMAHLGSGDGFVRMADGKILYSLGFSDLTAVPAEHALMQGMLAAEYSAPTLALKEGQRFYLNLTNVGMMMRPDLFDAHTIHWHGFPQAAPIFDGMPDGAVAINMGATFTYFYQVNDPGTYLYHCHVEATEHMQMGMLGQLFVTPKQNGTSKLFGGRTYTSFAYNDGDGSTGYDVEYPLQLTAFDNEFHEASERVQRLPFALMKDDYAMINGRGYPDTIYKDVMPPPDENGGKVSQKLHALIEANRGQRILLRLTNISVTRAFTVESPSIPMQVVGAHAKLLRSPSGENLYYDANTLNILSGESYDVILDTADIAPGTYAFYTSNLNYLSNNAEDFGGMMTEIVIH